MAICRGDAVVYIPACDTWSHGQEADQAKFWVECARETLFPHFDQECTRTADFKTWGDILFQDEAIKAHEAMMDELRAFKNEKVAVLLIFDEQGKVANQRGSSILSDALPAAKVGRVR
jgi:hypothetical protein